MPPIAKLSSGIRGRVGKLFNLLRSSRAPIDVIRICPSLKPTVVARRPLQAARVRTARSPWFKLRRERRVKGCVGVLPCAAASATNRKKQIYIFQPSKIEPWLCRNKQGPSCRWKCRWIGFRRNPFDPENCFVSSCYGPHRKYQGPGYAPSQVGTNCFVVKK